MDASMEISMENVSTQLYGEISMKKTLIAIAAQAAALQAAGAVRPEHNTKWQELRTAIDQAVDQAEAPAVVDPIGDQLERIAAGVDALREAAGV